jgi:hypothetical protein
MLMGDDSTSRPNHNGSMKYIDAMHGRLRRVLGDFYYRRCHPILTSFRRLAPARMARDWRVYWQRRESERLLAEVSIGGPARITGHVLVDGMWDNPHYWLRYSLVRAALGLSHAKEVGVVGVNRKRQCRASFRRLNVETVVDFTEFFPPADEVQGSVRRIMDTLREPADILECKLPFNFPATFLYDGILKRQRKASVDLRHGRLEGYLIEAFQSLYAADKILKAWDFKLVVMSHAIHFVYGALAWRAVQLNIPVIVAYGCYGILRYWRLRRPEDIFEQASRPTTSQFQSLPEGRTRQLAAAGRAYLEQRRRGETSDIGADHAYAMRATVVDRTRIAKHFGWSPEQPIVGVYGAAWFDFPHGETAGNFRDFLDWMEATLAVAKEHDAVNWLFKGHPLDEWYGGVTLADLIPQGNCRHIGLAPSEWNNSGIIDSIDAFVTMFGSVGIEAAAISKPVLVGGEGWYHTLGFVKWPENRQDYLRLLREPWWQEIKTEEAAFRARLTAGWYFCCPSWQASLIFRDDSLQDELYADLPGFLNANRPTLEREIEELAAWYDSDEKYYQIFKILRATKFQTPVPR